MAPWRLFLLRSQRAYQSATAKARSRAPSGIVVGLSALQEGSFMASLGMKCTSGSCLYEPNGPAPPAPVPHEHKTNLV